MDEMRVEDFHGKPLEDYLKAKNDKAFDCDEVVLCVLCWKRYRAGDRICKAFSPDGRQNIFKKFGVMFNSCPYCDGLWYARDGK